MALPEKLLVVGANGFLGAVVGRAWADTGREVLGLVRPGREDQVDARMPARACAETADAVLQVVDAYRPDVILHAAGSASVQRSLQEPAPDFADTIGSLQRVLEAVRRSGQTPVVLYPSSAAVYGQPETLPIGEDAPIRPISPYGHHKAMAELLVREYQVSFGIPALVFRLFSVFGTRQYRLLVWELFRKCADGGTITLQGTGEEIRDFIDAEDVARALISIVPRLGPSYTVVNIASGRGVRIRDVAEMVRDATGSSQPIAFSRQTRSGDPTAWVADTRVLRSLAPDAVVGDQYDLRPRLAAVIRAWRERETPTTDADRAR